MRLDWILFVTVINTADDNKQPIQIEPVSTWPTKDLCRDAETEAEWHLGIDVKNDPRGKMEAWGGRTRITYDCLPAPYIERAPAIRVTPRKSREERL